MNRPIKRLLALAGSATVGLFATVVFASPAQAHHPLVSGEAECVNGQYVITWTVEHSTDQNRSMEIVAITPSTGTVDGLTVGQNIPAGDEATGTQTVGNDVVKNTVTLKIKGKWWNTNGSPANVGQTEDTGDVSWPDGDCEPPAPAPDPTATFRNDCDGTISVRITNTHTAAVSVTVTGVGTVDVPAGESKDVIVPAGTAGPIIVARDGKELAKHDGWTRPESCLPPAGVGQSTCDKFTITVTNPQGAQSSEVTVTYGTQVKKVTVAPGDSEIVELSPGTETDAVLTFAGWGQHSQIIKYTKPADCPGLPVTGANTTTYIASGIGLVVIGFGAWYFARRRLAQLRKLAA